MNTAAPDSTDLETLLQSLIDCPRHPVVERACEAEPLAREFMLEQHLKDHFSVYQDGEIRFIIVTYWNDLHPKYAHLADIDHFICFDAEATNLVFHFSPDPPVKVCAERIFSSEGLFLPLPYEQALDALIYRCPATITEILEDRCHILQDYFEDVPELPVLTPQNLKSLVHRWVLTKKVAARHLRLLENGWMPYPQLPTIELLQNMPCIEPLHKRIPGLFQMLVEKHIRLRSEGGTAIPLYRAVPNPGKICDWLAAVDFDASPLLVQMLRNMVPYFIGSVPVSSFLQSLIEDTIETPLRPLIQQLPLKERPPSWLREKNEDFLGLPWHWKSQLHLCGLLGLNPSRGGPSMDKKNHPCILQLYAAPVFAEQTVRTAMGNYPASDVPLRQLLNNPDVALWHHVIANEPMLKKCVGEDPDPHTQKDKISALLDQTNLPPELMWAVYLLNDTDLMRKLLWHPALPLQLADLLALIFPEDALQSPVILYNNLFGCGDENPDGADPATQNIGRDAYKETCWVAAENDDSTMSKAVVKAIDLVKLCNSPLVTRLIQHRPQRLLIAKALFTRKFPDIWQRLAEDVDPMIRCALALNPFLPPQQAKTMARDPDPCVAALLASQNECVMEAALPTLIGRKQPEILEALAVNHSLNRSQVDCLPVANISIAWHLHQHPALSPQKANELSKVAGFTEAIHQRSASQECTLPHFAKQLKTLF